MGISVMFMMDWSGENLIQQKVQTLILSSPHCWLLTLNVDWFEPFECGGYSVGAIYLSIQNLPRDVRFRPENIILVGVYYQDQRSLKRQLIPIWLL